MNNNKMEVSRENNFKRKLKSGHIIETRDGQRGLIILNSAYNNKDVVVFSVGNWTELDSFNDDLYWDILNNYTNRFEEKRTDHSVSVDIMKVYQPNIPSGFLSRTNLGGGEMDLIWERPEPSDLIGKKFVGVETFQMKNGSIYEILDVVDYRVYFQGETEIDWVNVSWVKENLIKDGVDVTDENNNSGFYIELPEGSSENAVFRNSKLYGIQINFR